MKRQILWQYITGIFAVMLMGMTLVACHKDDDVLSGGEVETIDPSAPMHLYLGVNAGGNGLSWDEQSVSRAFSFTRADEDTRAAEIRPDKLSDVVNFNLYVDGDDERPGTGGDQSYIQSFMPGGATRAGVAGYFVPFAFVTRADYGQDGQQIIVPKPVIEAEENENKGYTIYLSLGDYDLNTYADGKLVIYYTMDGADPRESETSDVYETTQTDNGPRPIYLSPDLVLKAATRYERIIQNPDATVTEGQNVEVFWSKLVTFPDDGSIVIDPFFNPTEDGGDLQENTTIEDLFGDGQDFVVIDYNEATNHQNTGDSNADAQITRNHEKQYGFMGVASTDDANGDAPTLSSLMDYMDNKGSSYLQWNDGAKVMDTQCSMLIAKPAKTHDPDDETYNPQTATRDGDLILKKGSAYIPLVLRPAMACIQLCFHLSYQRAMTSGGAQSDDVGFRQYVITGIRIQQGKTPALTESGKSNLDNTGDPVSRVGANDVVMTSDEMIPLIAKDSEGNLLSHTLISDEKEGSNPHFTPIARFYVLPQSSSTEIKLPVTITYDVYDRGTLEYDTDGKVTKGNLLRKGETATSSLIFSRGYLPGYYYNIKIKIVPDFLYVMSDIDPDKPDDYVVVKNQ